jgi:lipopolysaccharide/colanic/teichoic acid biosynthesis glycosyltransferase
MHGDALATAVEPPRVELAVLSPSPVAPTRSPSPVWQRAKRPVDFAVSAALLVVLTPVILLIALAVRISSPGPVLYCQRRVGRDLREFTMLKFRTMYEGVSESAHRAYIAELVRGADSGEGLRKLTDDPRVTRVGRFLRKTSLDELPQLVNVLLGTMSLIGPRPAIEYELEHYQSSHYERFQVRPGLTGLWQVSGRAEVGFVEMLDIDVDYVRKASAVTDLGIAVRTPVAMLPKRTA